MKFDMIENSQPGVITRAPHTELLLISHANHLQVLCQSIHMLNE